MIRESRRVDRIGSGSRFFGLRPGRSLVQSSGVLGLGTRAVGRSAVRRKASGSVKDRSIGVRDDPYRRRFHWTARLATPTHSDDRGSGDRDSAQQLRPADRRRGLSADGRDGQRPAARGLALPSQGNRRQGTVRSRAANESTGHGEPRHVGGGEHERYRAIAIPPRAPLAGCRGLWHQHPSSEPRRCRGATPSRIPRIAPSSPQESPRKRSWRAQAKN